MKNLCILTKAFEGVLWGILVFIVGVLALRLGVYFHLDTLKTVAWTELVSGGFVSCGLIMLDLCFRDNRPYIWALPPEGGVGVRVRFASWSYLASIALVALYRIGHGI